jgi:hypothetical protein
VIWDEPAPKPYESFRLGAGILADYCSDLNSAPSFESCDAPEGEDRQLSEQQVLQTGLVFGGLLARCREALRGLGSPAASSAPRVSAPAPGPRGVYPGKGPLVELVVGGHHVGAALVALSESAGATWDCLRTDAPPSAADVGVGPEDELLRRGVRLRLAYSTASELSPDRKSVV